MSKVSGSLFKVSKLLHKYLGIIFLLYFILMGITGILINHPDLVKPFSVPLSFVPSGYKYTDWNRMSVREAVFSRDLKDTHYICGREGVWVSRDRGKTYSALKDGFPDSPGNKDTSSLIIIKARDSSMLYAGTGDGLYYCREGDCRWKKIDFEDSVYDRKIIDLINTGENVLAFTERACYRLDRKKGTPVLRPFGLAIDAEPPEEAPLYRLLFRIHDGSVFGLAGKLFADAVALVLIFLCIGAVYIWYMPWKKKYFKRKYFSKPLLFRFFHRYHLKLGIYSAFFIAVIAITGIFIRPPLIGTIMKYRVPIEWLNDYTAVTALPLEIKKAAYIPEDNSILLAAAGGKFYRGPADLSEPLKGYPVKVPVSGMGVNTLEPLNKGKILIGSFTGFFIWDDLIKQAADVNGVVTDTSKRSKTNMAGMSAGAAVKNGEIEFLADYRKGIKSLSGKTAPLMPVKVVTEGSMSFYSVLFEIHNARFFRDIFGSINRIIIPLGGILLVLTAATGTYDWIYRKL